jgi:group I intron endonuclease
MGYIYLRTNLVNGKHYVGQAKDIKERNYDWNNLNKRYAGKVINNARKKYGVDGFSFEILKECEDEELNYWEMYYIKMYNSKKPYGYNSTDGGDSAYEMTEETRKKIGDAHRGKKLLEETKAKIGAANRGKKLSEETKAKIGAASIGRKRSEETRKKIGDAHRGRKRPDIAAALRGMKRSEETKAKIADAKRGKYNTKKSKAVQGLDKITGEVVFSFPSTAEAQRQGFSAGNISECCRNCYKRHGNNIYKGLIWRFAV